MASRFPHPPTVLVTGGARGLGLAYVERLRAEGSRVFATARDLSKVPALEGVTWWSVDLADPGQVAAFLAQQAEALAQLDVLVNNAGLGDFGRFEEQPGDARERHWRVMVDAPMALAQAVLPGMRSRGRGLIINCASLAVELPLPYLTPYNTAKAGLAGFSRSLMLELAGSGVGVIDFRPGDFRTGFYGASAVHSTLDARLEQAWEALRRHVETGPLPPQAAGDLWKAIRRGGSGTVRSGAFFQRVVAAGAAHFLPSALMRRFILRYYGL